MAVRARYRRRAAIIASTCSAISGFVLGGRARSAAAGDIWTPGQMIIGICAGQGGGLAATERAVSRCGLRPGRVAGGTGYGRIQFVVVELVQVPGVATGPVQRALRSVVCLVQPFGQQPVNIGLLGIIGIELGPLPECRTLLVI